MHADLMDGMRLILLVLGALLVTATLVALRDTGRINDEVLSRTLHELDLEQAMLSR